MLRICLASCALAALAIADGFTFTIGSPVAAQDFALKSAAFVFRTEGCAEPAKAHVSGTAEGLVRGTRRSLPLKIVASSKPGIYAVYDTWPAEGSWLVNLKGMCASAVAGAIVPVGPHGFVRESSRFFPRPATDAEVEASLKEASLKAISNGGKK
jgi:hypothetical protein